MGHDNHDNHDHHHVDDLGGFTFFRMVWPAALLLLVVLITRNCCNGNCCGDSCGKSGAQHEMHEEHGQDGHNEGHGEHAPAKDAHH